MEGGYVLYSTLARPVDDIVRDLSSLGVSVSGSHSDGHLRIDDFYTPTLTGGRLLSGAPFELYEFGIRHSSSVADFSVVQTKGHKELSEGRLGPMDTKEFTVRSGWLMLADSFSVFLRFNEERPFLEWLETREHRAARRDKRVNFEGFIRGLHSESFYKRVEASCDGIVDVRVLEQDQGLKNVLRLRSLKGQPHDNRWHEIEIKPNGEAVIAR
jgi:hypothetical protein